VRASDVHASVVPLVSRSGPGGPGGPAGAAATAAAEREAFAEGYAQGERAGIDAAARQLDAQRARLEQTLDELSTLRDRLTRRTERQVVELALAVAGRILHREISLDRELLLVMARLALDRLGDAPAATVRLHPDDEAAVRGGRAAWPGGAIEVAADPSVKPGGCVLQTDVGHVDLGIDAQLGELSAALLGDGRPVAS
jgi:flagellar assembly protein FliH